MEKIKKFEIPKNKTNLQQLMEICNFYRRFHIRYNELIEPFRDLLKENAKWEWSNKHTKALDTLKEAFIGRVCLKHILPNKTFKIQTDASDQGIGGVIYQVDDNNDHRVISIVSRCLTETESHYTTTEKELLAIIYIAFG